MVILTLKFLSFWKGLSYRNRSLGGIRRTFEPQNVEQGSPNRRSEAAYGYEDAACSHFAPIAKAINAELTAVDSLEQSQILLRVGSQSSDAFSTGYWDHFLFCERQLILLTNIEEGKATLLRFGDPCSIFGLLLSSVAGCAAIGMKGDGEMEER